MTQSHPTSGAVPDPDCPVSLELLGQVYRADADDLPEILAVSDRVLVMSQGRIAGELETGEATQDAIMQLAVSNVHRENEVGNN